MNNDKHLCITLCWDGEERKKDQTFPQEACTLNEKIEDNGNTLEEVLIQPGQGGGSEGRLPRGYET